MSYALLSSSAIPSDSNCALPCTRPLLILVFCLHRRFTLAGHAADPDNPSIPDAQLGLAWAGLVLSILAAAGVAYYAVTHIQFETLDWVGSSFDGPCDHQPDLPRKKVLWPSPLATGTLCDVAFIEYTRYTIWCWRHLCCST